MKSEKVRGSRTRSRLKPQASVDIDDMESEMVEIPSTPRKLAHDFFSGDSPMITCEDTSEDAIFGGRSPSLPDILNVGYRADQPAQIADPLIMRNMPHQDDGVAADHAGTGPRVTFRTPSESDSESVTSQKSSNIQQQQQQQNLDFELDLTVDIDSGKCVFYPADDGDKDEASDSK